MLILPGSFLYCEGLVVTSVSSTVKVCFNFLFLLMSVIVSWLFIYTVCFSINLIIISFYYLFDFKTYRDLLKINNTAYLCLLSFFPLTNLTRGLLLLLFFQKTEFCLLSF